MAKPQPLATHLSQLSAEHTLFADEWVRCLRDGETTYLVYQPAPFAGAVGEAQGASLLQALRHVEPATTQTLLLWLNAAGAHFTEPMAGLYYLNAFLEELWRLKSQGVAIKMRCDRYLYGGMALTAAAVADEIMLTKEAQFGLLGRRIPNGLRHDVPPGSSSALPKTTQPALLRRVEQLMI